MYNKAAIVTAMGHFLTACKLSYTQVTICEDSAMVMHGLIGECNRITLAIGPTAYPEDGGRAFIAGTIDPFLERTQYNIYIRPIDRRIASSEKNDDGLLIQTRASLYRRYSLLSDREPFNMHYPAMLNAFKTMPAARPGDVVTALQDYLDIIERLVSQFKVDRHIHTDGDYELVWDRATGNVDVNIRGIRVITFSISSGMLTCMLNTQQLKEVNEWLLKFVDASAAH